MRIDLHSDDFGATQGVNANILTAWRAGVIDSVSVIANGDALHDAATEVKADIDRKIRLAVHLNLSEGYPLVDPSYVSLLVDNNGRFRYGFLGILTFWHLSNRLSRQRLINQVEVEWREQIRRVIEVFSPRSVTAVDGHIHVHMLPFLFPIAARLAREFDLPEIRISQEYYHFSHRESFRVGFVTNIFKHILLNLLSRPAHRVAKEFNLSGPDAIAGVLYSGQMTHKTAFAAIRTAQRMRLNRIELVFHPGRAAQQEVCRWSSKPGIAKFYRDPHRDVERDALFKIGAMIR